MVLKRMVERTPNLTDDVTGEDDVTFVPEGTMEVLKDKKRVVYVLEQIVSKRIKLSSQYIFFSKHDQDKEENMHGWYISQSLP